MICECSRGILLGVTFRLILLTSLANVCKFEATTIEPSTTAVTSSTFLENIAVYEGDVNTFLHFPASPNGVKWTVTSTSNELIGVEIVDYDDTVNPSYAEYYAYNSSGLIIKQGITNGPSTQFSTAGLYVAETGDNGGTQFSVKLLVVKQGPTCSCSKVNASTVQLNCSSNYDDSTYIPINAIFTLNVDGSDLETDTPPRDKGSSYDIYVLTSIFTTAYSSSSTYKCIQTFSQPTEINDPNTAMNAPRFNQSCSVRANDCPFQATTIEPSTTALNSSFPISMEPLFGPIAGGTNITVTGFASIDHVSTNAGSYRPDIRDVRNVYFGNDLSAKSVSILPSESTSSTLELVTVTPSTTDESIGQPLPVILEFWPTLFNTNPLNLTFNKAFTYLPNPEITDINPKSFIVNGGTFIDVTGQSLSSVAKPIVQLTVIVYRTANNGSTLNTSKTSTTRICTVPPDNDTYMQCPMPPLGLPNDFLEILNSMYSTNVSRTKRSKETTNQFNANSKTILSRFKRDTNVLTVIRPNGIDRADIYLGFILDGYKKYENINDALPNTRFIFYSAPEINSSKELLEFDPSEDELIYIKGRYMSRGCRLSDYLVNIGNEVCTNIDLQDNQLSCRPPKEESSPSMNYTIICYQRLSVTITLGYKQYQYSCLSYTNHSAMKKVPLIVGLTVGLAGLALFIAIITICILKCRKKELRQETDRQRNSGIQEIRDQHRTAANEAEIHPDYEPQEQDYDTILDSHEEYVNIIHKRPNTLTLYKPYDGYLASSDVDRN